MIRIPLVGIGKISRRSLKKPLECLSIILSMLVIVLLYTTRDFKQGDNTSGARLKEKETIQVPLPPSRELVPGSIPTGTQSAVAAPAEVNAGEGAGEGVRAGAGAGWRPHILCVIVPYRDRFENLVEFIPHMELFLNAQRIRHKFLVMNQVDPFRFNRASLCNVGYLQARDECHYMVFHDVDLLPLNLALDYGYTAELPVHIAAPNLHPRYNYDYFIGGILIMNFQQFEQVNGMGTKYWGWGNEDDEFSGRLLKYKIFPRRPVGITTGQETFRDLHDRERRPPDRARYQGQLRSYARHDYHTGLTDLSFTLTGKVPMAIEHIPLTVYSVRLNCDIQKEPWCRHVPPKSN